MLHVRKIKVLQLEFLVRALDQSAKCRWIPHGCAPFHFDSPLVRLLHFFLESMSRIPLVSLACPLRQFIPGLEIAIANPPGARFVRFQVGGKYSERVDVDENVLALRADGPEDLDVLNAGEFLIESATEEELGGGIRHSQLTRNARSHLAVVKSLHHDSLTVQLRRDLLRLDARLLNQGEGKPDGEGSCHGRFLELFASVG
ncbi:MAG: hypothetical protein U1D30_05395 [Planctomycetota bacterium]